MLVHLFPSKDLALFKTTLVLGDQSTIDKTKPLQIIPSNPASSNAKITVNRKIQMVLDPVGDNEASTARNLLPHLNLLV